MIPTLDQIIKYGPVICGLVAFLSLWVSHHFRGKNISLTNLFVVGASASSLPTAGLLIYGAFDNAVILKLTDAGVYIAFAGAALFVIFYLTVKEKW
jgi:hypothetical protein